MSDTIERFPYNRVEFTKKGEIFDQDQVDALVKRIGDEGLEDLIVISHGWNNDIEDAEKLYGELLKNADSLLDDRSYAGLAGRKIGVMGIFWPSKKFTAEELQPGGGASVASEDDQAMAEIDAIVDFSDRDDAASLGARAKKLFQALEDSDDDANEFVATITKLLDDGTDGAELSTELELPEDESGVELLELLADIELDDEDDEFVGGAAGLGEIFSGLKKGGARFMNMLTYFKMKKRAGTVGERGGAAVVTTIAEKFPDLRIHLVGHSFGGRLVSAIAKAHADSGLKVIDTMTLLQAAFSHHGFSKNFRGDHDGHFRPAIEKGSITGPIAVTFSENDKANGTAYPLASRLHREDAAGLGDADDRWGAIGRNGAVKTDVASFHTMLSSTADYDLSSSKILNFDGKDFISDHSDVKSSDVANLLLQVMSTAQS